MIFSGQHYFDGKTRTPLPTGFSSKGVTYFSENEVGQLQQILVKDISRDARLYRHTFLHHGRRINFYCGEIFISPTLTPIVEGWQFRDKAAKGKRFKRVELEAVEVVEVFLTNRYSCEIDADEVVLGDREFFLKFKRGEHGNLQFCGDKV